MRSSEIIRKWSRVAQGLREARSEVIDLTNDLPDGEARKAARETEMQIQSAREQLDVLHTKLEQLFEEAS